MPLLLHYESISKQLNNHNFSLQAILERIASSKLIHARMENAKTEAVARATRHISGTFFASSFPVLLVICFYFFSGCFMVFLLPRFLFYSLARGAWSDDCLSDVWCIESQHEAWKKRNGKVLLAKVTHMSLWMVHSQVETISEVRYTLAIKPFRVSAIFIH